MPQGILTNVPLIDETRRIGPPAGWDETLDGQCATLSIADLRDDRTGVNFQMTAWQLSDEDLELLRTGKGLLWLGVAGRAFPLLKFFVQDLEKKA